MPVPEIPIHRPSVGAAELTRIGDVLESRWLGSGDAARDFEAQLAKLVESRHVLAVASGTAALQLALVACEPKPGDEVILPSLTHVSCAQAVVAAGATPVFCDVELETVSMDVESAAAAITPRSRVLMPVDYAGFPAALDQVLELAASRRLSVVEDAAHAFGSTCRGRPVGSISDLTCFSFDPVKNITCGGGGAVATDDERLAERVALARSLGVDHDSWSRRNGSGNGSAAWAYQAVSPGLQLQLSDVQAAIGLAQLERFDELRSRKRELLRSYRDALADVPEIVPVAGDVGSAFPLLCAVRVLDGRRDALLAYLGEHGIQAWVHFAPVHLQPVFRTGGPRLPATERLYGELLTLPLYVELTDDDVDRVASCVREFFGRP